MVDDCSISVENSVSVVHDAFFPCTFGDIPSKNISSRRYCSFTPCIAHRSWGSPLVGGYSDTRVRSSSCGDEYLLFVSRDRQFAVCPPTPTLLCCGDVPVPSFLADVQYLSSF